MQEDLREAIYAEITARESPIREAYLSIFDEGTMRTDEELATYAFLATREEEWEGIIKSMLGSEGRQSQSLNELQVNVHIKARIAVRATVYLYARNSFGTSHCEAMALSKRAVEDILSVLKEKKP